MKKKDETIKKANDSIMEFYEPNYLENRINEVIKAFLEDPTNEIENNKISDLSNNKFNYLLSCINREVIKSTRLLIINDRVGYNMYFVYILHKIYIDMCYKFDKIPSLNAFIVLSGISQHTLLEWGTYTSNTHVQDIEKELLYIYYIKPNQVNLLSLNDIKSNMVNNIIDFDSMGVSESEVLTIARLTIFKNLTNSRESALKDRLISSKQVLGMVAIGNNEFGWSATTGAREEKARAIALSELPQLTNYAKELETIENP